MQLIHNELADILHHDSLAHPLPGTTHPGSTKSIYSIPEDEYVAPAKDEIQRELATALGYPDANVDQLKDGLSAIAIQEELDESAF